MHHKLLGPKTNGTRSFPHNILLLCLGDVLADDFFNQTMKINLNVVPNDPQIELKVAIARIAQVCDPYDPAYQNPLIMERLFTQVEDLVKIVCN